MSDEQRVLVITKVAEINKRRQVLVDRLRPGQKEQYAAIPKVDALGFCVWEMPVEMAREYIAGRLSTKSDFQFALYKSAPMWAEVRNPNGTSQWQEFLPVYAERYSVVVPDKKNPREDIVEWRTRFVEYHEGPYTRENCTLDNKERPAPALPTVTTELATPPASAERLEAMGQFKEARAKVSKALGSESVDAYVSGYCKTVKKSGLLALTDKEIGALTKALLDLVT